MRDLKLTFAHPCEADPSFLVSSTRELQQVASAFSINLSRLSELIGLCENVASEAMRFEAARYRVYVANFGTPFPIHAQVEHDGKLREAVIEEYRHRKMTTPSIFHPMAFPEIISKLQQRDACVHRGIEAVLASVVVGGWTAFESLAADLWEKSVNARPGLAFLALNAEPSAGDDEKELDRKKRVKFQIPAWFAKHWNLNLKDHMGTLLQDTGKWNFARRDNVRDAYRATFPSLWPSLESIFEDHELRRLAALRNAIVHNAGLANRDLLGILEQLPPHPLLSSLVPDEPIPLDGPLVSSLTSVAVKRGQELFKLISGFMDNG